MTKNVRTLFPHQTISDALEIMQNEKVRHIPIITENRVVIGIVTDRDIKEVVPSPLSSKQDPHIYETQLENIMTKNLILGHPLDTVEESAVVFYSNQIGSLPIVSNSELVGIITKTDLLYKYIELTGAHQPGSQIEVRVPNIPGILYEVSKVFHAQKTNVLSVLVYPDRENAANKILVIRIETINPLKVIEGLKSEGFEVLWPNIPGIDR